MSALSPFPAPRRTLAVLAALSTTLFSVAACTAPREVDGILRRGTVYDGSGDPPRLADVAVRGDSIVAVGRLDG